MVTVGSRVKIADNTGAKIAMIIGVPGGARNRIAGLGSRVTVVVKKALPHGMAGEHTKHSAVIVRLKKEFRRKDGSYIRFDDNAAVILDGPESRLPKGTRVFGPVARELKDEKYDKIISLAPEVL